MTKENMSEEIKRRIVSLSATGVTPNCTTQCNYVVVAVCDDGTAWQMTDASRYWTQLPEIPPRKVALPQNDAPKTQ
jgi:hypothetical protein